MLQETTWTVPEAVAAKADALKLTPEKAAIVRMLKANKTVAANLRADLRGGDTAMLMHETTRLAPSREPSCLCERDLQSSGCHCKYACIRVTVIAGFVQMRRSRMMCRSPWTTLPGQRCLLLTCRHSLHSHIPQPRQRPQPLRRQVQPWP